MGAQDPAIQESSTLGLRSGEWVEVRTAEEILATLDERGSLEALPFMPEMLQFCGKRFQVFKSAHKGCDTIENYTIPRRMTNAVHLEGLRCNGEAHGGCQARCLLYWKEAWLKRAEGPQPRSSPATELSEVRVGTTRQSSRCDLEALARATRAPGGEDKAAGDRYSCQATNLLEATTPLRWWDPRQYLTDLVSGNVRLADFIRYGALAAINIVRRSFLHMRPYPDVRGLAGEKTPTEVLDLQPGELVMVKSKDEVMRTLNAKQKNRGLFFDVEMLPHCGKTYRVLARVDRIIEEKTGRMLNLPGRCLILDGVICSGNFSKCRMFCPRGIYPYWREIWLKRVK
jgi:hypothetical protein